MNRYFLQAIATVAGLAAAVTLSNTAADGQTSPSRSVRIVVGARPAAPPEISSRIIATELGAREAWKVVVENNTGKKPAAFIAVMVGPS